MILSYRNWPVLKIFDKTACRRLKIIDQSTSADKFNFDLMHYIHERITNGNFCNLPIFFVSKAFDEAIVKNESKLKNILSNVDLVREIREDCVLLLPNGYILVTITSDDKERTIFVTLDKNMGLHGAMYIDDKCNFARTITADGKIEMNSIYTYGSVMAFKKYATVEVCVVEPHKKKKTTLDPDGKVVNNTGIEVTLLDSSWFREIIRNEGFKVSGHFRLQPCKDEKGKWTRKLIYIKEFEKHGYHRRAKMTIENNFPTA